MQHAEEHQQSLFLSQIAETNETPLLTNGLSSVNLPPLDHNEVQHHPENVFLKEALETHQDDTYCKSAEEIQIERQSLQETVCLLSPKKQLLRIRIFAI